MSQFDVTVGPDSTRYILVCARSDRGPQRRSGQRHRRFLGDAVIPRFPRLIYPIAACASRLCSAMLFPLMAVSLWLSFAELACMR